ncbi:hypothetical protein F5887DRAFT_926141 [Amanita rubescens]|nr:hypothetical protein F5887DRAFT_926141 [Amanita rubescens]
MVVLWAAEVEVSGGVSLLVFVLGFLSVQACMVQAWPNKNTFFWRSASCWMRPSPSSNVITTVDLWPGDGTGGSGIAPIGLGRVKVGLAKSRLASAHSAEPWVATSVLAPPVGPPSLFDKDDQAAHPGWPKKARIDWSSKVGDERVLSISCVSLVGSSAIRVTGGIIALMLGRLRMDVDDAIKHHAGLVENVFTDGKFKATKLKKAIKSVKVIILESVEYLKSDVIDAWQGLSICLIPSPQPSDEAEAYEPFKVIELD